MAVIIKVKVSLARTRPRPRPSAGCSLTTFHFLRPAAPRWRHTSSSQPPPAPSSCCCWYSAAAAAVQHQCAKTAAAENFLRAFRARSRDRAPADRDGVFSDDEQHTGLQHRRGGGAEGAMCWLCVHQCHQCTHCSATAPHVHMFTLCSFCVCGAESASGRQRGRDSKVHARLAILETLEKSSNNDMSASLNQGLQEKEKANINICNCSDFSPMNTLMVHRRSGVREV